MLVVGAAYEAGMRLKRVSQMGSGTLASICAQAGTENAAWLAPREANWRMATFDPKVLNQKPIGSGVVTVMASDPTDGMLQVSGGTGSSDADTVRFTATADIDGVTRTLVTDFVPLPSKVLEYAVFSNTTVGLQDAYVEGRIRANGDVTDWGGGGVFGDITTVTGSVVSAGLDDDDTDLHMVADSLFMPVVDFNWFTMAGAKLTLPFDRVVDWAVIDASNNPHGSASPRAIYWINASGGNVYFYRCAIRACIVILNANWVYFGGWSNWAAEIILESPDPDRLPALVVDGNLVMQIEAGSFTLGMQTYESHIDGVVYCTGELWGPQYEADDPILVKGALLANEIHVMRAGTAVQHDTNLNINPMVGLTGLGLRPVRVP